MPTDQWIEDFSKAWVDGQLRQWESGDDSAYAEMLGLVDDRPEEAWRVIVEIIARAPSEEFLFVVAAGPLEHLLERHGPRMIDAIEAAAREVPRIRLCLTGVWGNHIDAEVWSRMGRVVVAGGVPEWSDT